jgi:hypothetical protein
MKTECIEIIGSVMDGGTLRMMASSDMGNDLGVWCSLTGDFTISTSRVDWGLVNDAIEASHDPRWSRLFIGTQ